MVVIVIEVVADRCSLSINVNKHATSNAALQWLLVGASLHDQIHAGTCTWAGEDGLLKAELEHGLVNEVGLGRAVGVGSAVDLSTRGVGAAHGEAAIGTGAVGRALAVGAVDERNVVPKLVVDDAVLELGVLAGDQCVGLADLQGSWAAGVHGLRVLSTRGNVDGGRGAAWLDAPDPNVVRAAVADDGIACGSKGGLQSSDDHGGLGKHRGDGVD
jgi:hypothetical protein